jgi:hypothetical protein
MAGFSKMLLAAAVAVVVAAEGQTSAVASASASASVLKPLAAKTQVNLLAKKQVSPATSIAKKHDEKTVSFVERPHHHPAAPVHHPVAAAKKTHAKAAAVHQVVEEDDSAADNLESDAVAPASLANVGTAAQDGDDSDNDAALAAPLNKEMEELKESRTNIGQLEDALRADVSLLRESAKMQRVAHSRRGREAAAKQTKRSEQLVKVTSAMIKESRASSALEARRALRHSAGAKAAAEALEVEAQADLKNLEPGAGAPVAAAAPVVAEEASPAAPAVEKEVVDVKDDDNDEDASF